MSLEPPTRLERPADPERPACVYKENAPLAELATAELLAVATIRLWALPFKDPETSHPDWRAGLSAAGIEDEGVPAFDILFRIVIQASLRPLDVRCPRCARLGQDEAWLLQLVSLLQRDRLGEAAAVLEEWIPPAARRMAMLPAKGFADALSGAGLRIPLRHREAAAIAAPGSAAYADRGLTLVQ
jgi:hypothetical protein